MISKRQRLEKLKNCVAYAFMTLVEYTQQDVAKLTGLSKTTINRLWSGKITLATHFGTVQALAMAAGLELLIVDTELKVYASGSKREMNVGQAIEKLYAKAG